MQNQDIKKFFNINGYAKIDPPQLIDSNDLTILKNEVSKLILSYDDGKVDPKVNNSRKDSRFSYSNKIGDVLFNGCGLEHRYRLGNGSADINNDDNFLYGKRAILPERNYLGNMEYLLAHDSFCHHVAWDA